MTQQKRRFADIRRRLELLRLERERQNRELEELERSVAPADVQLAKELLRRPGGLPAPTVAFNPSLRG